jgi:hypothetical protein
MFDQKHVYVCYQSHYNYCDVFDVVVKIVDDEVKALVWKEEVDDTNTDWRSYTIMVIE